MVDLGRWLDGTYAIHDPLPTEAQLQDGAQGPETPDEG